ncbi:type VI secretion system lipoprotein TssJ [Methylobacter marinus]|uniref:type VI secretion system lipoprotein TssJ n=1 Tax=Methylobacter marinus TaxID=34058 RepID=UPI0018DE174F|nr:type VI secretion system lipoprotein TssJ [Methylobacter marinus]
MLGINSFTRSGSLPCLVICCLLILSGCSLFQEDVSSTATPEPFMVELNLAATNELNPDIEGRASPLVIRIYQFESIAAFNNSDFFALYENDQAQVGKDIKYREELEIRPGQKISDKQERQPGARYIAVLAAFRDLDQAQWKAFIEMKADQNEVFTVNLDKTSVSIAR